MTKLTPIERFFGVASNPSIDGGNPTGQILQPIYGTFNSTLGTSGVAVITFPTPFTTGAVFADAIPSSGTSVRPVIDSNVISKTGVRFIFPGVASGTAVKFAWWAIGW